MRSNGGYKLASLETGLELDVGAVKSESTKAERLEGSPGLVAKDRETPADPLIYGSSAGIKHLSSLMLVVISPADPSKTAKKLSTTVCADVSVSSVKGLGSDLSAVIAR